MAVTFGGFFGRVDDEGDGDEEAEDLFGGARAPVHQPGHVEHRVQRQKAGRPQADAAVEGVKIQVEILADAVNHFDVEGERRRGQQNQQRLTAEQRLEQAADGLADDRLFHVCGHQKSRRQSTILEQKIKKKLDRLMRPWVLVSLRAPKAIDGRMHAK